MEILRPENYDEFEKFNRSHPRGHFMQSAEWAALKSDWKREVVVMRGAGKDIRAGISILIRNNLNFNMSWIFEILFSIHIRISKETLSFLLTKI